MSLVSVTQMQNYSDKLAAAQKQLVTQLGANADNPAVAGTVKNLFTNMLAVVTGSNDFQIENDLNQNAQTALTKCTIESFLQSFSSAITQLNDHCAQRGSLVAASIVDLPSFLTYYNGGAGGAKFSSTLSSYFSDLYNAVAKVRLPQQGIYSPAINPLLDPTNSPNGMGLRAVGGSFTAGNSVSNTIYAEVLPLVVVTVNFAGGTAPPTVTVTGTDDLGNTAQSWTATLAGNNPTAAISTTITPAVNAQARQTVAFGSTTGIVVGSVLTVNNNLPDQEYIVVETVSGSNVTAVFMKAHNAGAAITGFTSMAMTPPAGGRRCRSVQNITIGITSHSAGTVRIDGIQDRVAV